MTRSGRNSLLSKMTEVAARGGPCRGSTNGKESACNRELHGQSFRANCDIMDESYVLEGYPHGCGVRLHSMVECLTSLGARCLLSTSIPRSYGFR